MKKVNAIITNENGEVCHKIKDIVKMALARNEMVQDTKNYIRENYSEYKVTFVVA